jgi:hypothetical protein
MVTFTSSATTVCCPFECSPLLDFVAVVSVGGQRYLLFATILHMYQYYGDQLCEANSKTRLNVITIQANQNENVSIFLTS